MGKRQKKTSDLSAAPQQVRLIAGCWRGTKLSVILKDDIRPTPVRVRETLFNWLQTYIEGSCCLDLFAGSGALGFEAVSRGAGHATLVDSDVAVTQLLSTHQERLDANQIEIVCANAIQYLGNTSRQFDIIFLDPPFSKFNLEEILQQVADHNILKSGGVVYVESSPEKKPQNLPIGWQWQRQSNAGQVEYGIISIENK